MSTETSWKNVSEACSEFYQICMQNDKIQEEIKELQKAIKETHEWRTYFVPVKYVVIAIIASVIIGCVIHELGGLILLALGLGIFNFLAHIYVTIQQKGVIKRLDKKIQKKKQLQDTKYNDPVFIKFKDQAGQSYMRYIDESKDECPIFKKSTYDIFSFAKELQTLSDKHKDLTLQNIMDLYFSAERDALCKKVVEKILSVKTTLDSKMRNGAVRFYSREFKEKYAELEVALKQSCALKPSESDSVRSYEKNLADNLNLMTELLNQELNESEKRKEKEKQEKKHLEEEYRLEMQREAEKRKRAEEAHRLEVQREAEERKRAEEAHQLEIQREAEERKRKEDEKIYYKAPRSLAAQFMMISEASDQ